MIKSLNEFYKDNHNSSDYKNWCKNCSRQQKKEKYRTLTSEEKKVMITSQARNNRARRIERRTKILTLLCQKGCIDCGIHDPIVLDFDHVMGKTSGIARMVGNHAPWSRIEKEITKCEIRCSNCHRRKTAKERNYYDGVDLAAITAAISNTPS